MRATMLAVLFLALGALTMSDTPTATADEPKKDPPKIPPIERDDYYTEKLSLRRLLPSGEFLKIPTPGIRAFRWEEKDGLVIYTLPKGNDLTVGSEFTDEKGNVYVIEKVLKITTGFRSVVKPKPKP